MIRVRVELLSAITGQTTELAGMDIFNDGTEQNPNKGNYGCQTYRGRSKEHLDKLQVIKEGKVLNYPRL